MKKCIVFVLGLFFCFALNAQKSPKNEIFVGVFSVQNFLYNNKTLLFYSKDLASKKNMQSTYLSNITYKRIIANDFAARISVFRPIKFQDDFPGTEIFSNHVTENRTAKIGIEYRKKFKKIMPYLAFDLIGQKNIIENTSGGGIVQSYTTVKINANGIGVSPAVGLNILIYKNIILGLESNYYFMKYKGNQITDDMFAGEYHIKTEDFKNLSINSFNPLIFSVGYQF